MNKNGFEKDENDDKILESHTPKSKKPIWHQTRNEKQFHEENDLQCPTKISQSINVHISNC